MSSGTHVKIGGVYLKALFDPTNIPATWYYQLSPCSSILQSIVSTLGPKTPTPKDEKQESEIIGDYATI